MVCSGTRQKRRATKGGTIAMQPATIQFDTELLPSAIAARHTRITQVAKSCVFFVSSTLGECRQCRHRSAVPNLHVGEPFLAGIEELIDH